jgi:hypothetical protein
MKVLGSILIFSQAYLIQNYEIKQIKLVVDLKLVPPNNCA